MKIVDLSSRPFLNLRPVRRTAALLWIIGVLLLGANIWLFGSYLNSSAQIRSELETLESRLVEERREISSLRRASERIAIERLNTRSRFLNRKIDARTFPWSRLFDDLESVLPLDVWLVSVQPEIVEEKESSSRRRGGRRTARRGRSSQRPSENELPPLVTAATGTEKVELSVLGIAQTGEDLLEFVDRLFDSPAFGRPVLSNESLDKGRNRHRFVLTVDYFTPLGETVTPSTVSASTVEPDSEPAESHDTTASAPDASSDGDTDDTTGAAASAEMPAPSADDPSPAPAQLVPVPDDDFEESEAGASNPSSTLPESTSGRPPRSTPEIEAEDSPGAGTVTPPVRSLPPPARRRGSNSSPRETSTAPATPPTSTAPPTSAAPPSRQPSTSRPISSRRDASSTARLRAPAGLVEALFQAENAR